MCWQAHSLEDGQKRDRAGGFWPAWCGTRQRQPKQNTSKQKKRQPCTQYQCSIRGVCVARVDGGVGDALTHAMLPRSIFSTKLPSIVLATPSPSVCPGPGLSRTTLIDAVSSTGGNGDRVGSRSCSTISRRSPTALHGDAAFEGVLGEIFQGCISTASVRYNKTTNNVKEGR